MTQPRKKRKRAKPLIVARPPPAPEAVPPEVAAFRRVRDALAEASRGLDLDQMCRTEIMLVMHILAMTASDTARAGLSAAQCERLARFFVERPG